MLRCSPLARRGRGATRPNVLHHVPGTRAGLATALAFLASMVLTTGAAQAVVVNDAGTQAGVALNYHTVGTPPQYIPGIMTSDLASAGVTTATSGGPCTDPWLSSDFTLPPAGLCYHGGPVMHSNETFALTWDPGRSYWQTTRNYVEQFLSDVASGSGGLSSPYADSPQYSDPGGRAGNNSLFGGGCIDYGNVGGFTCQFGNTSGSGTGNPYPNNCTATGTNQFYEGPGGAYTDGPNSYCLTDSDIQAELTSLLPQTGMLGHTQQGYTPLVVLLTPPGVITCLDASNKLCSANSSSTAKFCSYHSEVNVGGTEVAYVVQPWTASWDTQLGCDDPSLSPIPSSPDTQTLAKDVGMRLVSPLSQGQLAAITDPGLNGWYGDTGSGWSGQSGAEINDNYGCVGFPNGLDAVTVGSTSYDLQREFNNGGLISSDPNALVCTPNVNLVPEFVVPSSVNQGDEVQFDGSTTISTLLVPKAKYKWSFGDGTGATGPSVVHSYAKGGNYVVTLTVTDRGGNSRSLSQTVSVLGANGQPVGAGIGPGGLNVQIQLMPQSLRGVIRDGLAVQVRSNQSAAAVATISIPRSAARRAHIRAHGRSVVIGRGTVSSVRKGSVILHLHLSPATARKLSHLRRVTISIRLALVTNLGNHLTIDAAGRY